MLLHIADDTGEVLYCPECQRELWPAYWTEEGLAVCCWSDFEPSEGQAGLLICGNLNCTYEEEVTFTGDTADAVVWNLEDTYIRFQDEISWGWPQTWLLEYVAQIERVLAHTGRPKLRSALAWFQQEVEERRERLERWLAEAEQGYPVTFHAEQEKLAGQILASDAEEFVLQAADGQVRVLPKQVVWQEHIEYPRKPRKEREPDEHIFFPVTGSEFIVVGGYHLAYGEPTELGGYYTAHCWDPVAAVALRLREEAPGYWEGTFRAEEIERYYERHDFVKIRGYWLEESGRNEQRRVIWGKTTDPDVAQALDMGPLYTLEGNEFGGYDGEIYAYGDYFSIDEIAETRWEEEVQPFPPDHW